MGGSSFTGFTGGPLPFQYSATLSPNSPSHSYCSRSPFPPDAGGANTASTSASRTAASSSTPSGVRRAADRPLRGSSSSSSSSSARRVATLPSAYPASAAATIPATHSAAASAPRPAPGRPGPYASLRQATSARAAAAGPDPSPRRRAAAECVSDKITRRHASRRSESLSTRGDDPGSADATAAASSSNARYLALSFGFFASGAANAASSANVTLPPDFVPIPSGLMPSKSVASRSHFLVAAAASSTDLACAVASRAHASTSRGCARTPSTAPGVAKSPARSLGVLDAAVGNAGSSPPPRPVPSASASPFPVRSSSSHILPILHPVPSSLSTITARCRNPPSLTAGVSMSAVLSTTTSAAVPDGGGCEPASGAAAAAVARAIALDVRPSAKHSNLTPMCAPIAQSWLARTATPGGTGACAPSSSPPSSGGGVVEDSDRGCEPAPR